MTMNSVLISVGVNTKSILTIRIFKKYVTWKVFC